MLTLQAVKVVGDAQVHTGHMVFTTSASLPCSGFNVLVGLVYQKYVLPIVTLMDSGV